MAPEDIIAIRNLRIWCIIGIHPEERARKQELVISLTLRTDLKLAGKSDRIEDTVSYQLLRDQIVEKTGKSSYFLIEKLANEISELCLSDPRVSSVTVMVEKPTALKSVESVGVQITRFQGDNHE